MQKRLFLIIIVLIVLFPAIGVLTGIGAMSDQEMQTTELRNKTKAGENFPKWFADSLGLRHFFLKTYSALLFSIFGQPTHPEHVLIGKNNFLFLGDIFETSFSAHSGIPLRSQKELQHLGEGFEYLLKTFQDHGIPVLLVIAPDKESIYGEYFPAWVKKVVHAFPRDNFVSSPLLNKNVIFLEDALLQYKDKTDYLYWKNETHWNQLGAFLGYHTIMESLEKFLGQNLKRVHLLGWKTGEPLARRTWMGDLAKMNLGETEVEFMIDLVTDNDTKSVPTPKGNIMEHKNDLAPNKLNIAIIYDSFYNLIPDIYRKTFSTIQEIHFNSFIKKKNIEALLSAKPPLDLVLILIVERTIPIRDTWLQKLASEMQQTSTQ